MNRKRESKSWDHLGEHLTIQRDSSLILAVPLGAMFSLGVLAIGGVYIMIKHFGDVGSVGALIRSCSGNTYRDMEKRR